MKKFFTAFSAVFLLAAGITKFSPRSACAQSWDYSRAGGYWFVEKYTSDGYAKAVAECTPGQDWRTGDCHSTEFLGENAMLDQGIEQALQALSGISAGQKKNYSFFGLSSMWVGTNSTPVARTDFCLGPGTNLTPNGVGMDFGYPKLLNLVADTACPPIVANTDCGYIDTLQFKSTFGAGTGTGTWTSLALTNTPNYYPYTCCGDCDADSSVTTTEYNLCDAIRLGSSPLSDCYACDCNADGTVTQTEVTFIGGATGPLSIGCFSSSLGSCLNRLVISPGSKGASDVWIVTLNWVFS